MSPFPLMSLYLFLLRLMRQPEFHQVLAVLYQPSQVSLLFRPVHLFPCHFQLLPFLCRTLPPLKALKFLRSKSPFLLKLLAEIAGSRMILHSQFIRLYRQLMRLHRQLMRLYRQLMRLRCPILLKLLAEIAGSFRMFLHSQFICLRLFQAERQLRPTEQSLSLYLARRFRMLLIQLITF
jgi:hypothetical protein